MLKTSIRLQINNFGISNYRLTMITSSSWRPRVVASRRKAWVPFCEHMDGLACLRQSLDANYWSIKKKMSGNCYYGIFLLVMMLTVIISSCSSPYATTGEHLYLHHKHNASLVIPPPLRDDNISNFYTLPHHQQHAKLEVDINPPTI